MTDSTSAADAASARARSNGFYFAAWRWHFYAGLYVVPFLLMLALTGLVMLWFNSVETRFGAKLYTSGEGPVASLTEQAAAAVGSLPGGVLKQYIAQGTPDRASLFVVEEAGKAHVVGIDPHGAAVLGSVVKDDTWFYFASDIHGTLLIGDLGDRLIEIAAGFGIVLIVTGVYMWWPRRGRSLRAALLPDLRARRRQFWKELHVSVGFYTAIVLFFFLISGLAWAGIWGERFVQAWSTFPAEKWDNVPLSDKTHASMNHGALHDVPWGLEQTPLPASGSDVGLAGTLEGEPVDLDTVATLARRLGFEGQFRINVPGDETGVFTISADSMSGDTVDPTTDRTVHVDRYTGRILAEVGFADYSLAAKSMAVGIALHQGDLGLWNTLLNTLFCLAVILLSVTGIVMWWMRRPAGAGRLVPPPMPENLPLWKGAVAIMLGLSLAFPLVGLTLLAVLAADLLVLSRLPALGRLIR